MKIQILYMTPADPEEQIVNAEQMEPRPGVDLREHLADLVRLGFWAKASRGATEEWVPGHYITRIAFLPENEKPNKRKRLW